MNLENQLFRHMFLIYMPDKNLDVNLKCLISISYYVVRDGVVYNINRDFTEYPSGDSVKDLKKSAKHLGDYRVEKIQRFDNDPRVQDWIRYVDMFYYGSRHAKKKIPSYKPRTQQQLITNYLNGIGIKLHKKAIDIKV